MKRPLLFLLLFATLGAGLYGQLPEPGNDSIPWWKTIHVLDMTMQCQRADLDSLMPMLTTVDRCIAIRSVYPADYVAHAHRDTLLVLLHCADRSPVLPASIGNIKNLRVLDLYFDIYWPKYGNILCLPEEIGNLSMLQEMNLEGNSLNSLPASFKNLQQLRVLNLTNNLFRNFPAAVTQLAGLQVLRLDCLAGYNGISVLPAAIGNMKGLRVLGLSGNNLATLPAEISKLTQLESLNLASNKHLRSLPASLAQLRALRYLNLTDTGLAARDIARIRAAMPWCEIVY